MPGLGGITVNPAPAGYIDPHNWSDPGNQNLPWDGADNNSGLLASCIEPEQAGSTFAPTAGTIYLAKIPIRTTLPVVSNMVMGLAAAGVGASSGSFAGLYDSAGNRVAVTADLGATLVGATGPITLPFTAPIFLPAGLWVWGAFVSNLATTQPTVLRNSINAISSQIANLTGALRFATGGTGQTSLPASINTAGLAANANAVLMGIS